MALPVFEELDRILQTKLRLPGDRVESYSRLLRDVLAHETVPWPALAPAVTGDRADDAILACAVEESVEVLVSGDRAHLLPLRAYGTVAVLSPQQTLTRLR